MTISTPDLPGQSGLLGIRAARGSRRVGILVDVATGIAHSSSSLVARARQFSSPWPTTKPFVVTVLVLTVLVSVFASVAQDHLDGWHFIGHSLVLWIILATGAATHGNLLQGWATSTTTLIVAVATYYTATRTFGPFDAYPPLAPLLMFWGALAIVGGFGFALLCITALRPGWSSFPAVGVIAGLMVGDAINTAIGIPYLELPNPFAALASISLFDPVFTVAWIGAGSWILTALLLHHRQLLRAWLIVPGLLVGHILVSIPDLLLHYA